MELISVIVPVYNVEKYLSRCVSSILSQTYSNFECILVDDGSKDTSGSICDSFSNADSRIRVIHQDNGGVTSARRHGLAVAKGDWIMFVDSDDTIPQFALEVLYKSHAKGDIIMGCWEKVFPGHRRIIPLMINGRLNAREYAKALLQGKCYSGPVGKLMKKRLFKDDTMNLDRDIIINEDLIMNLRLASRLSSIYALPYQIVYEYHYNPNSSSVSSLGKNNWEKTFDAIADITTSVSQYYYRYVARILYFLHTNNISIENIKQTGELHEKKDCDPLLKLYLGGIEQPSFVKSTMIRVINQGNIFMKLLYYLLYKIKIISV